MNLKSISFLPQGQDLFDIIYPVGSVIFLATDTNPNTFFNKPSSWERLDDNINIKISSGTPGVNTGNNTYTFTPSGTFSSVYLNQNQSPILAMSPSRDISDVAYVDGTNGGGGTTNSKIKTIHNHDAGATVSIGGVTYQWYFALVQDAWRGNIYCTTSTVTSARYTLTTTAISNLNTINNTTTITGAHTHTITLPSTTQSSSSHSISPSYSNVSIDLTGYPKLNLAVWKRIT